MMVPLWEEEIGTQTQGMDSYVDYRGRDWSDVTMSQGMNAWGNTGGWKLEEVGRIAPWREHGPAGPLISDSWPPEP